MKNESNLFLILSILLILTASCKPMTIRNSSFESKRMNGLPGGWDADSWIKDTVEFGTSREEAHSGRTSLMLYNKQNNHSFFSQKINLPPHAGFYKVTAWIKTDQVSGGKGAGIALEGFMALGGKVKGTTDWQECNYYFKKHKDVLEVTLMLTLGHYSSLSRGKAWFDSLSIERIMYLPDEGIHVDLLPPGDAKQQPATIPEELWKDLNIVLVVSILLLLGGGVLFVVFLKKTAISSQKNVPSESGPDPGEKENPLSA